MSIAIPKVRVKSAQRPEPAVPEFPVARMTVPEYLSLVETGFFASRRVELWEGWVVDRMTHGSLPAMLIMLISEWLFERRPKETAIRTQVPAQLRESCLEPDIAVVKGTTADYGERLPTNSDILLVIEVSDTTLASDRSIKSRMYAEAGLQEYWIINCEDRQVEVYTDPLSTGKTPHYRQLTTYLPGQSIVVKIGGKKVGELAVNALFGAKK